MPIAAQSQEWVNIGLRPHVSLVVLYIVVHLARQWEELRI